MGSKAFYTPNQAVTITLASLANGAFAVSDLIDNSVNKFLAADIQIKITTGMGIPAFPNRPTIAVFILRSVDGGLVFDDANDNAQLVDVFQCKNVETPYVVTADTSLVGQLPTFWKLVIKNKTGAAFDSNPSNFSVVFVGKKWEATPNGV